MEPMESSDLVQQHDREAAPTEVCAVRASEPMTSSITVVTKFHDIQHHCQVDTQSQIGGSFVFISCAVVTTGGSTVFTSWANTRVSAGSRCHVTTNGINSLLRLHGEPTIFNNQFPYVK